VRLASEGKRIVGSAWRFRGIRRVLFLLWVSSLCCALPGEPTGAPLAQVYGLKHGVFAFYSEDCRGPAAILRVGEVRRDYQRKGFFRIGLLPMAVAEEAVFELHRPDRIAESLEQCTRCLGARSSGRVELRDVQFVAFGSSTNRLVCGWARPGSDGRWELLGGVRFESAATKIEAACATLQVTGPKAGQLIIATIPPLTNNLCLSSP